MFWFNGANSRFERLTFDGAKKAHAGFAFRWNDMKDPKQWPSHRISLADVRFQDSAIGFDGGGKTLGLDSEVLFERCKFFRCTQAGANTRHFNACDWWFWYCEFDDCNRGVTNVTRPYGGHFHVYESVFRNSTEADISIYHTAFFGIRNNYSIGSKRFFHAENNGPNGSLVTLQGNTIVDSQEPDTLYFETIGNINLMDNVVISRADAKGPVVRAEVSLANAPAAQRQADEEKFPDGFVPMTLSAIGNTYTVADPISVHGRKLEMDTKVVDRSTLQAG